MADSRLFDKAIRFLQYEKEIYGNFDIDRVRSEETRLQENNASEILKRKLTDTKDIIVQLEEITTLEELEVFCRTSDLLKTDLEGTNLVMGKGNPKADLMIIGEAPGRQEDLQGEPFVGRSGQLLTKVLKAINFERDDVYIANILKHRPPDNRDPLPDERLRSLPFLIRQIRIIDPMLILCLGRISAQTLLKTSESMKILRGKFHPYLEKYELMVTYHPAALLRNPHWKKDTWEDVRLLRKRYDELGGKP